MECLDIQRLRRCCRPDATYFDETEIQVISEDMVQFFLYHIDAAKVVHKLHEAKYISLEAFKSVERHLGLGSSERNLHQSTRRVLSYISNKTSFVSLLWALSTCGYHSFANLLLVCLERKRHGIIPKTMNKYSIKNTRSMYILVKQLKFMFDSNLFANPVAFIRRLAIRFQGKLNSDNLEDKFKNAEKYFGTLLVEIDFSFMNNKYVSIKALQSEMRRVIPFTSNPFINEALLNGRLAEMAVIEGEVRTAKELIHDVIAVMMQTERCPETGYHAVLQLSILLHDYELSPSAEKKQQFMQIGENSLRMIEGIDEEFAANFKIYIMQRIVYCALGLSITGKPIPSNISAMTLCTSGFYLSEIGKQVKDFGLRRMMCYKLAMGRLVHLKGQLREAAMCLKEAKEMAKQGNFIEFQNIVEYKRDIRNLLNFTQ